MNTAFSRRGFIKASTTLLAASTLPRWYLEEAAAQPAPEVPKSANDKPGLALIGCGSQGRHDLQQAARFGNVVALCDLDASRLAEARQIWPKAATHGDFRKVLEQKDVDVVICATVDHWHVLVSMAAMRAGKDVYCEEPLSLTVAEGRRLVKTARETKRILQTGSQQRSDKNFRLACELARHGRLGKLQHVAVFLPDGRRAGPFQAGPVPAGLNWDFWMGQTPAVAYVKERCHETFRYWWEYAGGTATDWGAHHNDIALWGLGLKGPVRIEGKPLVEMIPGGFTAFSKYGVNYTYANGVTHSCHTTAADSWSGSILDPNGQRNGIRFSGSDGWVWVRRGSIEASHPDLLNTRFPAGAERLYVSHDHMANFFECVRTRKPAICDPEAGHRSASLCHLGTIALRTGKRLQWDPDQEEFVGDAEANRWLAREMRKPYDFDMVGG